MLRGTYRTKAQCGLANLFDRYGHGQLFYVYDKGERYNGFQGHFFPQNWWCDFAHHWDRFDTIKYSRSARFYRELIDYLKQQGAPESTLIPLAEAMPETKVQHETYKDPRKENLSRQIYSDPEVLQHLVETYYYDFVMFDLHL